MIRKPLLAAFFILFSVPALSALQCGPFNLEADSRGWYSVNGERAKTQKITYLKEKGDEDNVSIRLRVKNAKAPGMLDMTQTTQAGKGTLRAEIVRTQQSQIRIHGSYDCEKVN